MQVMGAGSKYSSRLLVSVVAVVLLAIVGVLGYHWLEGWSLLDSFYMVVITFTTVGYGTIDRLSPAGTVLTILMVIFGVAMGLNLLAIGAEYVMEGHLAGTIKRRRSERMISRLEGHYIVCGYGRMGQGVVNELLAEGEMVCVVDRGEDLVQLAQAVGLPAVLGDATEERALIAAGLSRAKGLVAALANDAQNAFVTLTARTIAPEVPVVARAESESSLEKLRLVGADHAITPYDAGAQRMTFMLTRPLVAEVISWLVDERLGKIVLRQVKVPANSRLDGLRLRDMQAEGLRLNVLAVKKRGSELEVMPGGDYVIAAGDDLVVVGPPDQLTGIAEERSDG
jgi:voltage-gated potassium channel